MSHKENHTRTIEVNQDWSGHIKIEVRGLGGWRKPKEYDDPTYASRERIARILNRSEVTKSVEIDDTIEIGAVINRLPPAHTKQSYASTNCFGVFDQSYYLEPQP